MATLSPFKDESFAAAGGAEPMSFDELPFEDLLQSVLRGAVWEEQLVAGAPAGAAGGAAAAGGALAHQAVSRSGGLRCLDASHAADCELCLPPPVVGEEALYELAGDVGLKNGEKKLRSLLARCPEWADDAARMRLADALDASPASSADTGGGRLTSCLRGTDTMAALRKVDLIALARGWGYRCHLWRRRRACSRVTQRALASLRSARGETGSGLFPPAATAPAAPLIPLEPFDTRGATSASVASYIAMRLQPLSMEVVRLYRGEEARDTAVAHGWPFITAGSCDEVRKVYLYLSGRHPVWQRMLLSITALRARLPANEVAFRALAGNDASEVLQRVEAMVATAASMLHRSVAAEAARRATPNLALGETAWLEEMHRARMMGLEMMARLQALLANAKFDAIEQYLDTCTHVLHFMMNFLAGLGAAFELREAWMRRLIAIDSGAAEEDSPDADPDAVPIFTSPLNPERAGLDLDEEYVR